MLTRKQKEELVDHVADEITQAKSVVLTDFRGVSANDIVAMKKQLAQVGGNYRVIKKTLLKIAAKRAGVEISPRDMDAQIAMSSSMEDEVAVPKALAAFAKENENLKIMAGMLGTQVLSEEEVTALAKLPTQDELRAKVVGTLNAPVSGFVNVLAGNIRGLVQVLNAVSEKKEA